MIMSDAEIDNVLALAHFDTITKVMPGQIPVVGVPGRREKIYPKEFSMWFSAETAEASVEMARNYMLCEAKKFNHILFRKPNIRIDTTERDGIVTGITYAAFRAPMEVMRRSRYFSMSSARVAADLSLHGLKFEAMPFEYQHMQHRVDRYFLKKETAWVTLRTVACEDSIAAYHQMLNDIVKNSENCDTVWHTNDVAFVPAHGTNETGGQKYHAELVIFPFNSKLYKTPWGM